MPGQQRATGALDRNLWAVWCWVTGQCVLSSCPESGRAVGEGAAPTSSLPSPTRLTPLRPSPAAAVNNSSDTESVPSPRTEAAKDTGQNGPKPPPAPGTDAPPPEPPTPPPEDAPAPAEPALAPEATGPPTSPLAPPASAAPLPVVPKEEKEEEAIAPTPVAAEGEEQKPAVAPELAADVGKKEEPDEVPPAEPIKTECKEEAAEDGPDQGPAEAGTEPAPEAALKAEKKEAGGGPAGKAPPAKGSGAPQDSDSSATCSADEVDEPEGGDKNR